MLRETGRATSEEADCAIAEGLTQAILVLEYACGVGARQEVL